MHLNALHLAETLADDSNFRQKTMDKLAAPMAHALLLPPQDFASAWLAGVPRSPVCHNLCLCLCVCIHGNYDSFGKVYRQGRSMAQDNLALLHELPFAWLAVAPACLPACLSVCLSLCLSGWLAPGVWSSVGGSLVCTARYSGQQHLPAAGHPLRVTLKGCQKLRQPWLHM